jgi:hypothetical protein
MTTTKIGSHAAARFIFDYANGPGIYGNDAPEGWKYLGAGCNRAAYLAPDGFVYKVGNSEDNRQDSFNSRTYRRNRALRALGINIPRANLYRMPNDPTWGWHRWVVAMEFVDQHESKVFHCSKWMGHSWADEGCTCEPVGRMCWDDVRIAIQKITGWSDLHDGNVIFDQDERIWIIDLGE